MKRIKSNVKRKKSFGFTLIEVLVGVAIASVGIVGVLELQKKFIKSGNEVNARAIAMQLIREKFDSLKAVDDFTEIAASSYSTTKSTYDFKRSSAITNFYYDSDAADWSNTSSTTNKLSGKSVKVTVVWVDINGVEQSLSQTEVFSKISLHDSDTSTNNIDEKITPKVAFASYQSVENPPIELIDDSFVYEGVGNSKETSKPIPTVYAFDNNNLIQFETVVFDPASETQTLEDFATVNCVCSFNGSGEGATPTMYRLSNDGSGIVNDESSGGFITKTIGKASGSKQPDICDTCCRDHHDDLSVTAKYSSVSTSSSNHKHFSNGLDVATSGEYIEACRLRRVDGFYKVVPDWQLVDVVTMPISYFNVADNVTEYVSYVKYIVKAYMLGNALPTDDEKLSLLPNRNLETTPGTQQIIARGIYVDTASLSASDLSTIVGFISTKANWLEYVPFYEINLSLFGDWNSSNTTAVSVTNEDINTIIDTDNNYYGTYSRGRVTANSVSDQSEVSISVRTDNTGITGSGAITSTIASLSDSINIKVDNGSSGVSTYGITIEIDCLAYDNSGSLGACKNTDTEGVTFTVISGTSISCVYSPKRGSSTAFLSCSDIPDGWSGTIRLSNDNFTFGQSDYIYADLDASAEESALMTENP